MFVNYYIELVFEVAMPGEFTIQLYSQPPMVVKCPSMTSMWKCGWIIFMCRWVDERVGLPTNAWINGWMDG